jgi:hypothetical protein
MFNAVTIGFNVLRYKIGDCLFLYLLGVWLGTRRWGVVRFRSRICLYILLHGELGGLNTGKTIWIGVVDRVLPKRIND